MGGGRGGEWQRQLEQGCALSFLLPSKQPSSTSQHPFTSVAAACDAKVALRACCWHTTAAGRRPAARAACERQRRRLAAPVHRPLVGCARAAAWITAAATIFVLALGECGLENARRRGSERLVVSFRPVFTAGAVRQPVLQISYSNTRPDASLWSSAGGSRMHVRGGVSLGKTCKEGANRQCRSLISERRSLQTTLAATGGGCSARWHDEVAAPSASLRPPPAPKFYVSSRKALAKHRQGCGAPLSSR